MKRLRLGRLQRERRNLQVHAAIRGPADGEQNPAIETDSFTVRVSDGVNDPVDVTVPVGAVAELIRNTVVDTVGTGNFPLSVALSPNGSRAYVLNGGDDTVTVIDTATNTAIATIPVGNFTYAVAVSPLGDKVYATNIDDRTISVIDAASNTELTTIPFDGYPYAVAVSANGSRLYVTSREDGSISVFDTASNTVIDTLDVGDDQVADVALSPVDSRIYVANTFDATITVIDGDTFGVEMCTRWAARRPRSPSVWTAHCYTSPTRTKASSR